MTKIKTKDDVQEEKNGKGPTHLAYHVRDYKKGSEDKAAWTRIGAAWLHEDGAGLNLQLDVMPLDGRITIRVPMEKDEKKDI